MDTDRNTTGYLEVILGCMYSGKTTRLMDIHKMYSICGIDCCVINYAQDQRYHAHKLSTHDLRMIDSINTTSLKEVVDTCLEKYEVFLINEGQFFEDLLTVVTELVEDHSKKVYVCGLDGDFKRRKFGQILDLIPMCDKVTKRHAICKKCKDGTRGCFSMRLTSETEQVCIGSDSYIPVCRQCYRKYTIKTT